MTGTPGVTRRQFIGTALTAGGLVGLGAAGFWTVDRYVLREKGKKEVPVLQSDATVYPFLWTRPHPGREIFDPSSMLEEINWIQSTMGYAPTVFTSFSPMQTDDSIDYIMQVDGALRAPARHVAMLEPLDLTKLDGDKTLNVSRNDNRLNLERAIVAMQESGIFKGKNYLHFTQDGKKVPGIAMYYAHGMRGDVDTFYNEIEQEGIGLYGGDMLHRSILDQPNLRRRLRRFKVAFGVGLGDRDRFLYDEEIPQVVQVARQYVEDNGLKTIVPTPIDGSKWDLSLQMAYNDWNNGVRDYTIFRYGQPGDPHDLSNQPERRDALQKLFGIPS